MKKLISFLFVFFVAISGVNAETLYYTLGKSNSKSIGISQYYWEVIKPITVRDSNDVANFLLATVKHPITGEEALVVDDTFAYYTFAIHPAVSDGNIDQRTQGLENVGILTASEKSNLRVLLKGNKGNQITVLDLIPKRYKTKPKTKTYAEMEADGWFDEEI